MEIGWFTVITLIITFCIIDMFDTIGTLVGTASRAGMLDSEGNMPKMKQALTADAIGTITGSLSGTSTVTTFVESASGVEAGGRTGSDFRNTVSCLHVHSADCSNNPCGSNFFSAYICRSYNAGRS